jgi:hypothetical protein
MVLSPEKFAEMGGIDFYLHPFLPCPPCCSRLFIDGVHLSDSSHEPHIISLMPERSSHQLTG